MATEVQSFAELRHIPPLRKRTLSLRTLRRGGRSRSSAPTNGSAVADSSEGASAAELLSSSITVNAGVSLSRPPVPPLPFPLASSRSAHGRLECETVYKTGEREEALRKRSFLLPKRGQKSTSVMSSGFQSQPQSALFASSSTQLQPPAWPKEIMYQKCYCEESSYLLARQLEEEIASRNCRQQKTEEESERYQWDVWVVVVSNNDKAVLLWQQKASNSPELNHAVLWDYHVFVMISRTTQTRSSSPAAAVAAAAVGLPASQSNGALGASPRAKSSGTALPSAQARESLNWPSKASANATTPPRPRRTRSLFGRKRPDTLSTGQVPSLPALHHPPTARPTVAAAAAWCAWVYDIDSCLCSSPGPSPTTSTLQPVPFDVYVDQTFAHGAVVCPRAYLPTFRLVRAAAFLDNFASDRSHMLVPTSPEGEQEEEFNRKYSAPVPTWPLIRGRRARRKGWTNNLMDKWVKMGGGTLEQSARRTRLEEVVTTALTTRTTPLDQSEWQGMIGANQSEEMKIEFGKVLSREEFFEGKWEMVPWRRRGSSSGKEMIADGETEVTMIKGMALPPTLAGGSEGKEGEGARNPVSPAIEPRKGGRVKSPLFPAYMAASQQARAQRPRDSYLALTSS